MVKQRTSQRFPYGSTDTSYQDSLPGSTTARGDKLLIDEFLSCSESLDPIVADEFNNEESTSITQKLSYRLN